MAEPGKKGSFEREIDDLKCSIEKHLTGEGHLSSEVVSDLTKAINDLSDHMVNLHRRIQQIEDTHADWTTQGWMPPPGGDRPS